MCLVSLCSMCLVVADLVPICWLSFPRTTAHTSILGVNANSRHFKEVETSTSIGHSLRKRTTDPKVRQDFLTNFTVFIFNRFKIHLNLKKMSAVPGDFGVPTNCKCYAAKTANGPLEPYTITRRACSENDVVIGVKFAGICHSDIHQVKEEWGKATFPM